MLTDSSVTVAMTYKERVAPQLALNVPRTVSHVATMSVEAEPQSFERRTVSGKLLMTGSEAQRNSA